MGSKIGHDRTFCCSKPRPLDCVCGISLDFFGTSTLFSNPEISVSYQSPVLADMKMSSSICALINLLASMMEVPDYLKFLDSRQHYTALELM